MLKMRLFAVLATAVSGAFALSAADSAAVVTARSLAKTPADFPAVIAAVEAGTAKLTGKQLDDEAYYRAQYRLSKITAAEYVAALKKLSGPEFQWGPTAAYSFSAVAPDAGTLAAFRAEVAAARNSGDADVARRGRIAAAHLAIMDNAYAENAALLLSPDVSANTIIRTVKHGLKTGDIDAATLFTGMVNKLTSENLSAADARKLYPWLSRVGAQVSASAMKTALQEIARTLAPRTVVLADQSNAADAAAWGVLLAQVEETLKRY